MREDRTRREVLSWLAVVPGLLALAPLGCSGRSQEFVAALETVPDHPEAWQAMGAAALEQESVPARTDDLLDQIREALDWRPGDPPEDLPLKIKRAIQRDFESGRIDSVAGWQMAATEVRIGALLALAPAA